MRRLSKSLLLNGQQCAKRLWWLVNDPDAPELIPDDELRKRFDDGGRVGRAARAYVPGGTVIGSQFQTVDARLEATHTAIARGDRVLYEASFAAADVLVHADILERSGDGWNLVEVKSSTRVKDAHGPDVAIQVHVARAAGLDVRRAEVMHLNRECRFPDLSNLFSRRDVTAVIEEYQPHVAAWIAAARVALEGGLPEVAVGDHCDSPYTCPFHARCWGASDPHHISTVHGLSARKRLAFLERGWTTIGDLPDDVELPVTATRQVRSVRRDAPIIEPTLADALTALAGPLTFLDFETINPPIPVWPGCRPYDAIPVQFSCHIEQPDGSLRHVEHLVEGAGDPRPEMAHRLVAACLGRGPIVTWNVSFERMGVRRLAEAAPELAGELDAIAARLVDLLPVVRNHVYYPAFGGGFSLKSVLPVLVPDLGYGDLAVREGGMASVYLAKLLLDGEPASDIERALMRKNLLAYCERDTMATVRLVDALRDLSGPQEPQLSLF